MNGLLEQLVEGSHLEFWLSMPRVCWRVLNPLQAKCNDKGIQLVFSCRGDTCRRVADGSKGRPWAGSSF